MFSYKAFHNAVLSLWRNKWMTVATVTVMSLTLFAVGLFVVINILVVSAVDNVKSRIDLEVFFKKEATEDQIIAIKNDISTMSIVKSSQYVTKEEALKTFKELYKNSPEIIDNLTEEENPLPASVKFSLYRAEELESLNKIFKGGKYDEVTDSTSYENNKLMVQRLIAIGDYTKRGGAVLSFIFIITTLMVVFNTIRINIYTRKEEIEIMRLVGATSWYIRWPFILEGSFYGLISATIALLVLFAGIKVIEPKLLSYLGEFSTSFYSYLGNYAIEIIGLQYIVSIALGVASSFLAIGRYIKI